jgi:hypothetical protein
MANIFYDNFSTDKSWSLDSGAVWERGSPAQTPPGSAYDGSNVIATDLSADYPSSISPMSYATSPVIDCSNHTGVTISFRRHSAYENSNDYDSAHVDVYDGSTWQNVWNSDDTSANIDDASWTLQAPSISTYGDENANFQIRFGLDSDFTSEYRGWFLDAISVDGTPGGPTISDVDGDEDIYESQTNVTITGNTFESEGANSRVRLNAASNGLGTDVVQVDTSWSDTSINFTVDRNSVLFFGLNYLFVRNQSTEENADGFPINIYALHYITVNSKPSGFRNGDSVTITGVFFSDTQSGSEFVHLMDTENGSGTNIAQTVTSWSNTSITFTVVQSSLDSEEDVWISVVRDEALLGDSSPRRSAGFAAELLPPVPFTFSASSNFAQNDPTTQQLTTQSGAFEAGKMAETTNPEQVDLDGTNYTEIEYCFKPTVDALTSTQYEFRVKDNEQSGEKLESYNKTPKLTIST